MNTRITSTPNMISHLLPLMFAALIVATFMAIGANAQEFAHRASFGESKEPIAVNVLVGQSRILNFDRPIGRFSVSNPDVAEAVLVAPDQVVVNGKTFGQINFIAWDKDGGQFIVFDVFVRTNLSLIDAQVRVLFPKDDIRLSQANGSVVLSGTVSSPDTVLQADSVVQAAGFKTVNLLRGPILDASQVQLQVRVAEVSRNRLRDLGATYAYQSRPGVGGSIGTPGGPYTVGSVEGGSIFGSVTGSALNLFVMGGNTFNFIRALQTQGALRSLAEPNLIAMNGQKASFLAGGEFPVPVVQDGGGGNSSISVIFKEYGVRLNFTPTIIDEDHIRLELEPEVSTLDFANGVRLNGFLIPGLKTRRAKTGIELRDGQSFALAGLLDNSETKSLSRIPYIADIPVLGNLFKSKSFQRNETELIFIVTAQLVRPVNRDELPNMRGVENLKNGSPLGIEPKGSGVTGETGYSTGDSSSTSSGATPGQPLFAPAPVALPAQQKVAPPPAPPSPVRVTVAEKSARVNN